MSTNPDRIVLWVLFGVVMWLVYLHFADQPTKYEPLAASSKTSTIYVSPGRDSLEIYNYQQQQEQMRHQKLEQEALNNRIDCLAARQSDGALGFHRNC